ncbi:CoB--CoM heterodisulfide reductase iron-sulfur subunit A family protein [Desulfatirhabdium butyrativorans]|uniref:CoB--CoM heterodisulfide reductase iron-sulfur subunit A family protein n=1 Tax=Desulfatirhabdium butyrativorans TaxID=340467 RepID=UPI0003F7C3B5|nr:CoB--CoM heterodisulfide reductase iron-sulfur subunit A family protein [Desulfatirhabdium butyrativorans]
MEEHDQSQKPSADAARVGVYICYCGGNISDHVDVEKVRERVEKLPEVTVARTNMFMCSDPGQEMILEDLRTGKCDRVVVASCSPSLHEGTFRSAIERAEKNPYIYDHANIREQVSWVHHGEAATDKAFHLIAMASAKARQLSDLNPIRVPAKRHATVIGGGVAGLRAAIDLAENGIEVALLEKTPFLGGNVAKLDRLAPTGESARTLLEELAAQVLSHSRIRIYGCTEIQSVGGYVGNFQLKARIDRSAWKRLLDDLPNRFSLNAGAFFPGKGVLIDARPPEIDEIALETGSLVLATGFRPYRPATGEYGFGAHPEVITLSDLISAMQGRQMDDGFLRFQGRKIRSIGMIHCVGSRQIPGIHPETEDGKLNEYCSRTCCASLLSAAKQIRLRHPRTAVYDFYRDIRTYGRDQESLYEETARNGVIFFRFEPEDAPQVEAAASLAEIDPLNAEGRFIPSGRQAASEAYPLTVTVKDTLTFGEEIRTPVDLVVLATGMEPGDVGDLVDQLKIPVGNDGFLLEVHPKLRPVELPVRGLLLAGTCQAPMDVGEACNGASAAAVKAAALLGKGYVELDPFVAEVDLTRCDGCGACVEACIREGALTLEDVSADGRSQKRPVVTPALCLGCGACVAVCPHNAIDVAGWTLRQYEAMVDRIVMEEPIAA